MKRLLCIFTSLMLTVSLAACGGSSPAEQSGSADSASTPVVSTSSSAGADTGEEIVIDIWGWETEDDQKPSFDAYKEVAPNVTLKMTLIQSQDMPVKVQTALASDSDMPDICWIEMGVRGKMLALDCWEDLTKAPFNIDTSLLFESMIPLGTNTKGEFVGLDDGPSMAALAYKREMALELLGTDDPAEVEAMFQSWDDVIRIGKEIKDKTNGEVYMFPGLGDVMTMLKGQSNIPFADGDTLQIEKSLGNAFDLLIKIKEAGIVDGIDMTTPAWNATIAERNHLMVPCPYWGPNWLIGVNDPDNKNTWGLIIPPDGGYPWGGTCWSVAKNAKNKDATADFINWYYMSEAGGIVRRDAYGYTIPLKSLYDAEKGFYSGASERFGGQDILNAFTTRIAASVQPSRQVFEYDSEVNDALNLVMTTLNASSSPMTVDEIVSIMEDDIIQKVPDLHKAS